MKKLDLLCLLISASYILLSTTFVQAQTKTWDGGAGTTNWHDAANWNDDEVPSKEEDVILPAETGDIVVAATDAVTDTFFLARNILLENGTHLRFDSLKLGCFQSIVLKSNTTLYIDEESSLNIAGSREVLDGIHNSGTIDNYGQVMIQHTTGAAIYNASSSARINNYGRIDIFGEAKNRDVAIENNGHFTNHTCSFLFIYQDQRINNVSNDANPIVNNGLINTISTSRNAIDNTNGRIYNTVGGDFADAGGTIVTTTPTTYHWMPCSQVADRDWFDAANWDVGLVPTATIAVVISDIDGLENSDTLMKRFPTVTQLGATAQSLSLEAISEEDSAKLTIEPCSSLSVETTFNNDGILTINGLLRIGGDYTGEGRVNLDDTTGFVYQPFNTSINAIPICDTLSDRCFDFELTDAAFSLDEDSSGLTICQNDLAALESLRPPVLVQAAVYLEGGLAYLDGEMILPNQAFTMSSLQAHLSEEQPFKEDPWFYVGTENVTEVDSILQSDITDWLLIEAYKDGPNPTLIESKAALLHKSGQLVDPVNGKFGIPFGNLINSKHYHIVVRPRNHLAVMSKTAILVEDYKLDYDFTTGIDQALGMGQLAIFSDGISMLKSGDLNSDGIISVIDFNLLINTLGQSNSLFPADLDLDGVVEIDDFNLYQMNSSIIGISIIRY